MYVQTALKCNTNTHGEGMTETGNVNSLKLTFIMILMWGVGEEGEGGRHMEAIPHHFFMV